MSMSVLIIMVTVPMTVSTQRVVIIVNVLLDTIFNLTSIFVKVSIVMKLLIAIIIICGYNY